MSPIDAIDIRTSLPGPRAKALLEREQTWLSQNYVKDYPLVVERAVGTTLIDVDGNRFLDFAAGIAVCATGHCHPQVVAAIQSQAERLLHLCAIDFSYPHVIDLAERLAAVAPGPTRKKVYFANSGAEAVETAIKLARLRTGRQKVVGFFGAFHGRTMGAVSLTASKAVQRRGYAPFLPEVHHTHYATCYRCPVNRHPDTCSIDCLDLLEETLFSTIAPPDEIAAIVVEPILGEGGYHVPKREFLERLATIAGDHGILLVADEVQTGFGRTGRLFACEHFGIEPDIMVLAKGIASGMPISAVVAKEEIMQWRSGGHGSTFGGNPVSCAAAMATLDLLEGGLIDNAADMGTHLLAGLRELQSRHRVIGDVRGLGLMIAVDLVKDRETREPDHELLDRVLHRAFEKGLALLGCGTSCIRIAPPLVVTKAEADAAIAILDSVLSGT
ncbi:MAG: acetyl ornithine aminotransferase family protein [Acidobacteriota bacterium]|nr:acetyl ornithine aminotransferase family protein [Acidobacteriota bacterium]